MFRDDVTRVKVQGQRGVALVELSAWMVALLPPMMFAVALLSTTHERNMLQLIPESLMRESGGRVTTWRSDREGGFFEVDLGRVRRITALLANRASEEVSTRTFKLKRVAARACYWVYEVNTITGSPGIILAQGCEERNDPRGDLSVTLLRARDQRVAAGISEPVRIAEGAPEEHISRSVVFGVAVGGDLGEFEEQYEREPMQHAAAWIPRGDVGL